MSIVTSLLLLALLFYALSRSADVVVVHVRKLGALLGVPLSHLGIILGILTTLPEISIAINAARENIIGVSLGNLFGGIPVIIGGILGASALANRKINTSGNNRDAPFLAGYLLLPAILGLDGTLSAMDGLILIALYGAYLSRIFTQKGEAHRHHLFGRSIGVEEKKQRHLFGEVFVAITAITGVVVFSNLIVEITSGLLVDLAVPAFFIGLLVFSFGTNLPEISVAIRSWRRGTPELSLGHLLGSAAVNPLVIGVLVILRPSPIPRDPAFFAYTFLLAVLLGCAAKFVKSGRRLTAREGAILLALFVVILASQVLLLSGNL